MERPMPVLRPVWLTGILLFIAALSGRATTSEYVNYVSGPSVADVSTVITVADDFHGWLVANPGQTRMWHGPVANRVRLRYTGADNNSFGQDDWELTVDFIVSYWDAQTAGTSAATGTATGSVTVSYDATAGTFYTDEAVFKIPGGHRMEVDVTQATFLVNGATAPPGYPFPTDVELEAAIEIERYFDNWRQFAQLNINMEVRKYDIYSDIRGYDMIYSGVIKLTAVSRQTTVKVPKILFIKLWNQATVDYSMKSTDKNKGSKQRELDLKKYGDFDSPD